MANEAAGHKTYELVSLDRHFINWPFYVCNKSRVSKYRSCLRAACCSHQMAFAQLRWCVTLLTTYIKCPLHYFISLKLEIKKSDFTYSTICRYEDTVPADIRPSVTRQTCLRGWGGAQRWMRVWKGVIGSSSLLSKMHTVINVCFPNLPGGILLWPWGRFFNHGALWIIHAFFHIDNAKRKTANTHCLFAPQKAFWQLLNCC